MNRHGETREKNPPPGEYWLCPLASHRTGQPCEYKLLRQALWGTESIMAEFSSPSAAMYGTERLTEVIRARLQEHNREREQRMMDHLKTHERIDFYLTHGKIISDAHKRADEITSLADKVFLATATQERPEEVDGA